MVIDTGLIPSTVPCQRNLVEEELGRSDVRFLILLLTFDNNIVIFMSDSDNKDLNTVSQNSPRPIFTSWCSNAGPSCRTTWTGQWT